MSLNGLQSDLSSNTNNALGGGSGLEVLARGSDAQVQSVSTSIRLRCEQVVSENTRIGLSQLDVGGNSLLLGGGRSLVDLNGGLGDGVAEQISNAELK